MNLLTGYPSFLARAVLSSLLEARARGVTCLVPDKMWAQAETFLAALPHEDRDRVTLLRGDVASIDFGLSGAAYLELARKIRVVHHTAKVTYLGAPTSMMEAVNVGGALEVVQFAKAATGLRSLVHYSSTQVFGDHCGFASEEALNVGQTFRNPVEETLARAERVVRGAGSRVPLVVVRPSVLVGDSRSGEVDRLEAPYLLIWFLLTRPADVLIPMPGTGEVKLHLVPVDYVAKAAVHLGELDAAIGKTIHLADPAPKSAKEIFSRIAEPHGRAVPLTTVPSGVARLLFRAPGIERLLRSPRTLLELLSTDVTYGRKNADAFLAEIACPALESYLPNVVSFVSERIREKKGRPSLLPAEEVVH